MNFKYSLLSDLHLDYPQPKLPYDKLEENVIVAGDTANGLLGLKFLNKLRNKGHQVYAVDGNHEHYGNVSQGRTITETTSRFQEDFMSRADITDEVSILLINGWYRITAEMPWRTTMNDYRNCHCGDPMEAIRDINRLCFDAADFIKDTISNEPDRKFVIVTHTSPCVETLDPRFEGAYSNEWYLNPMMREILENYSKQILIWNHGHTHAKADKIVSGVRVVCNPRGYPSENKDYEPMTISLDI